MPEPNMIYPGGGSGTTTGAFGGSGATTGAQGTSEAGSALGGTFLNAGPVLQYAQAMGQVATQISAANQNAQKLTQSLQAAGQAGGALTAGSGAGVMGASMGSPHLHGQNQGGAFSTGGWSQGWGGGSTTSTGSTVPNGGAQAGGTQPQAGGLPGAGGPPQVPNGGVQSGGGITRGQAGFLGGAAVGGMLGRFGAGMMPSELSANLAAQQLSFGTGQPGNVGATMNQIYGRLNTGFALSHQDIAGAATMLAGPGGQGPVGSQSFNQAAGTAGTMAALSPGLGMAGASQLTNQLYSPQAFQMFRAFGMQPPIGVGGTRMPYQQVVNQFATQLNRGQALSPQTAGHFFDTGTPAAAMAPMLGIDPGTAQTLLQHEASWQAKHPGQPMPSLVDASGKPNAQAQSALGLKGSDVSKILQTQQGRMTAEKGTFGGMSDAIGVFQSAAQKFWDAVNLITGGPMGKPIGFGAGLFGGGGGGLPGMGGGGGGLGGGMGGILLGMMLPRLLGRGGGAGGILTKLLGSGGGSAAAEGGAGGILTKLLGGGAGAGLRGAGAGLRGAGAGLSSVAGPLAMGATAASIENRLIQAMKNMDPNKGAAQRAGNTAGNALSGFLDYGPLGMFTGGGAYLSHIPGMRSIGNAIRPSHLLNDVGNLLGIGGGTPGPTQTSQTGGTPSGGSGGGNPPTSAAFQPGGQTTARALKNMADALGGIPHTALTDSNFDPSDAYHQSRQAIDLVAQTNLKAGSSNAKDSAGLLAINKKLAQLYGPALAELIYAGPGGINIKNGKIVDPGVYGHKIMAQHHDHVHVAATSGSLKLGGFDAQGRKIKQQPSQQAKPQPQPQQGGGAAPAPQGNCDQWIKQALSLIGQDNPSNEACLKKRAMNESGCCPNCTPQSCCGTTYTKDSNFYKGTPSLGIAQMIQSTFDAHKVPGCDDILNPVCNLAASWKCNPGHNCGQGGYGCQGSLGDTGGGTAPAPAASSPAPGVSQAQGQAQGQIQGKSPSAGTGQSEGFTSSEGSILSQSFVKLSEGTGPSGGGAPGPISTTQTPGWYHTGLWDVPKDQLAWLQRGEMVVAANAARYARDQSPTSKSAAGRGDINITFEAGAIQGVQGLDSNADVRKLANQIAAEIKNEALHEALVRD